MATVTSTVFVVTRTRLARSPLATGPGMAWTWLYYVRVRGQILTIAHGLGTMATVRSFVRRYAREHLGNAPWHIECEWKPGH